MPSDAEVHSEGDFFERSPFRSGGFLVYSLVFGADLFCVIYILREYWNRLPPRSGFYLIALAVFLPLDWASSLVFHRRVRKLTQSHAEGNLGAILGLTATFVRASLVLTATVYGILLTRILDILSRQ